MLEIQIEAIARPSERVRFALSWSGSARAALSLLYRSRAAEVTARSSNPSPRVAVGAYP